MRQTKSSGFTLATSLSLSASDRFLSSQQPRSYAFKSVTRQKRPTWVNRFVKDSYDLVYQTKDDLIKENNKQKIIDYNRQLFGSKNKNKNLQNQEQYIRNFKKRPKTQQMNKNSNKGYNIINIGKNEIKGISSTKYSQTLLKKVNSKYEIQQQMYQQQQKQKINKIKIKQQQIQKQKQGKSPKKTYHSNFFNDNKIFDKKQGLSQFQYTTQTIQGKIQSKTNHHLDFQKKPDRPININNHWYDMNQDIDTQLQKNPKIKIRKCHSFKSYLPHKTFQPAQSLDKFYDTDKAFLKYTKPQIHIGIYDMKNKEGRKDWPKKQGTHLQYNTQGILDKIKQKILGYKLSVSQRKIVFSKQVINPEKGCYR